MQQSIKLNTRPGAKAAAKAAAKAPANDSAQNILDIAEQLAQTRGYNGFSYADIAERLGVTKASLHYHFASKAELGRALIARYHVVFAQALAAIELRAGDPVEKLRNYVDLYDAVMNNDRMCLCGMLAAEYATLPRPMQQQLKLFFDANELWLTAVLDAGCRVGRFGFKESAGERAQVMLGALEGAMLVARSYGDPKRFRLIAQHILEDLCKFEQTERPKAKTARKT